MTAARPEEVRLDLGSRSYPIVVGVDVLAEIGPRLQALGFAKRCALVTSERVGTLYREPVVASLCAAGLEPAVVEIPDGEEHKNLAWLTVLYDRLIEARLDRRSPVIALGGGVISDIAGFAAATLLRGLPWAVVPTTLIGQVDAAVGGKTAIDHAFGKNLVGAFHQPRLVLADVGVLRTLPRRELAAGLAEVVKYGVIGDRALFADLETRLELVSGLDPEVMVPMVAGCCRQKARVVEADEREERGARAVLNFGHTVGHAVEALTEYRQLLHGEAVAIGMAAAARVSRDLGRCGGETVERIVALLKRAGLPTDIPSGLTPAALALAMQSDKKSTGGHIRFVAVEEIGRTAFIEMTAQEIVSHF